MKSEEYVKQDNFSSMYNFSDRTILITGGAGILGGEIACALINQGANVAILERDPNLAKRIQDRLDCGPGSSLVVFGDVLDQKSLVEAKEKVESSFGFIDTLVNAAGGNHPQATTSEELAFFGKNCYFLF